MASVKRAPLIAILSTIVGQLALGCGAEPTDPDSKDQDQVVMIDLTEGRPWGINEVDQVTGSGPASNSGDTYAWIWQNGSKEFLWVPSESSRRVNFLFAGQPRSMNDLGQVLVGVFQVQDHHSRDHRWGVWSRGSGIRELTPGDSIELVDINNRGQVLGNCRGQSFSLPDGTIVPCVLDDPDYPSRGGSFVWGEGGVRFLGFRPTAINEVGQVIGKKPTPGGSTLWENGVLQDLGTLGGEYSLAIAVNNLGDVVGESNAVVNGYRHAFFWRDGVMQDLGVLEGDNRSVAVDVNDLGQVLVMSWNEGEPSLIRQTFVWQDGVIKELPMLGCRFCGARGVVPVDINNKGQVTGRSSADGTDVSEWHGFLWDNGVMWDLGIGSPVGINDLGHVVGYLPHNPDVGTRAVLWMIDSA